MFIKNVVRFYVENLKLEYGSDGGWKQYLPATKTVKVEVVTLDKEKETYFEVKKGQVLEFTPDYYDWDRHLNVGTISIS